MFRSPPRGPHDCWLAGVGTRAVQAHISSSLCLLININRLNVAWAICSMFKLGQRGARPPSYFELQFGYHLFSLGPFHGYCPETLLSGLRWVDGFLTAISQRLLISEYLHWHSIVALAITSYSLHSVSVGFLSHFVSILADGFKVWKAGGNILIQVNNHINTTYTMLICLHE